MLSLFEVVSKSLLPPPDPMASRLSFDIAPTDANVRTALVNIADQLAQAGVTPDDLGVCQIVLAEALNNIVEHACAQHLDSRIKATGTVTNTFIQFRIHDTGSAMPHGRVPPPTHHDLGGPTNDLPEGGFGWNMIHLLTQQLTYNRKGDTNTLQFRVPRSA